MFRVGRFCLLVLLVTAFTATCFAQIAFIRKSTLYVLKCDRTGRPIKGAKAFKVARLWPLYHKFDQILIGWTPRGEIWIDHFSSKYEGIWIVKPNPNSKLKRIVQGHFPAFSPDEKRMAFTPSSQDDDLEPDEVRIMNLKSHDSNLFATNSFKPIWLPKGNAIAIVSSSTIKSSQMRIEVRRYPSGQNIHKTPYIDNLNVAIFSPNASFIAIEAIEKALCLYDLRTGKITSLRCPNGFDAQTIDDWTLDGKWILCLWAKKSDNSWRPFLGLSPVGSGKPILLGPGSEARFTSDGKHMVFLRDRNTSAKYSDFDLVWGRVTPGAKTVLLASHVEDFAIMRTPLLLQQRN